MQPRWAPLSSGDPCAHPSTPQGWASSLWGRRVHTDGADTNQTLSQQLHAENSGFMKPRKWPNALPTRVWKPSVATITGRNELPIIPPTFPKSKLPQLLPSGGAGAPFLPCVLWLCPRIERVMVTLSDDVENGA